jgi:preprotein translocase subunit SecE
MKRKTIIISIISIIVLVIAISVYILFYNSGSGSACPYGTLCQPYGMAY